MYLKIEFLFVFFCVFQYLYDKYKIINIIYAFYNLNTGKQQHYVWITIEYGTS